MAKRDKSQPGKRGRDVTASGESRAVGDDRPNIDPGPSADTSRANASHATHNPFDPARYRLTADYQTSLSVKRVVTNVPCRKPNRQEFVRVRPGEEWRLETLAFEDKAHCEVYLVDPDVASELAGETVPVCLHLTVNRQNDAFL